MKELNTFKDVAQALREAEEMRERGDIQQVTDSWVDTSIEPPGACAAGGIALVCSISTKQDVFSWNLRNNWPIFTKEVRNPDTGNTKELLLVISTLNEDSLWDWNKIADWLESLDQKQLRQP